MKSQLEQTKQLLQQGIDLWLAELNGKVTRTLNQIRSPSDSNVSHNGDQGTDLYIAYLTDLQITDTALIIHITNSGLGLDLKLDLERKLQRVIEQDGQMGKHNLRVYYASNGSEKIPRYTPPTITHAEGAKKSGSFGVMWQLKPVSGVKNVILVASGKGGVGKSAVSINLAAALHLKGAEVGLVDADIYGPSAAMMLGIHRVPNVLAGGKIEPLIAHGMKAISLGFLYEPDQPALWRGPMVAKAVRQLFYDVDWGELDYLIVDLPPGTGDVQLTIIENIPIQGALIVSSPQDIATLDAQKAITMFTRLDIPIIGMIENMAYFECSKCHEKHNIFGSGGVHSLAEHVGVKVLASLPLLPEVMAGADQGLPGVLLAGSQANIVFMNLAEEFTKKLAT